MQIDVTTKPKQDRIYPPLNAREGKSHWAGAARPKASPDDALYREGQTDRVYTPNNPVSLSLTLRQKAVKLGMIPGSPRWKAYVLGTEAASRRRRREKDRKGEQPTKPAL